MSPEQRDVHRCLSSRVARMKKPDDLRCTRDQLCAVSLRTIEVIVRGCSAASVACHTASAFYREV